MNRKRSTWIGIIGFTACTVLLGGYLLSSGGGMASGQTSDRLVGVVEGTEVDLAFKMAGSIAHVYVKEGQTVKAGDLIADLTSDELLAKREQAAAAYELAKAKLEQARTGVAVTGSTVDAQISQTQAAIEAAKAQYEAVKNGARPEEIAQLQAKLSAAKTAKEVADVNLKRMQDLYAQGAVPKAKVEEAQTQYDKAAAEYAAADEQLKMTLKGARNEQIDAAKAQWEQASAKYREAMAARGQVAVKESDVKSAEAGVRQAKGALDEVDAYLRNTKLVAPVDGVIKTVGVQAGELVAQGYTVATIQAKDDTYVKFYVDEDKLGNLKVGDKETLFVPALNKQVTGTIQVIAPAADFAVKKATQELGDRDIRAFEVKIGISGEGIRPGYSVEWQLKGDGGRE